MKGQVFLERRPNPSPRDPVRLSKTIAAFLNTNGGELIIGVSNKHTIIGIASDIKAHGDLDKLECSLRNSLKDNLSITAIKSCRIKFEPHGENYVCRIQVVPAREKVFAFKGEFFKRNENQTISLNAKEYHQLEKNENISGFFPVDV